MHQSLVNIEAITLSQDLASLIPSENFTLSQKPANVKRQGFNTWHGKRYDGLASKRSDYPE